MHTPRRPITQVDQELDNPTISNQITRRHRQRSELLHRDDRFAVQRRNLGRRRHRHLRLWPGNETLENRPTRSRGTLNAAPRTEKPEHRRLLAPSRTRRQYRPQTSPPADHPASTDRTAYTTEPAR